MIRSIVVLVSHLRTHNHFVALTQPDCIRIYSICLIRYLLDLWPTVTTVSRAAAIILSFALSVLQRIQNALLQNVQLFEIYCIEVLCVCVARPSAVWMCLLKAKLDYWVEEGIRRNPFSVSSRWIQERVPSEGGRLESTEAYFCPYLNRTQVLQSTYVLLTMMIDVSSGADISQS